MLFSWLADKLFKGRRESAEARTQQVWDEWDARRLAAEEAGQPFDEPQPEQVKSGRRRWGRGRPSPLDAGAAGATGAFLVGPHIDHGHHGHHGHGGFDGGFHGGGGDVGGGGF